MQYIRQYYANFAVKHYIQKAAIYREEETKISPEISLLEINDISTTRNIIKTFESAARPRILPSASTFPGANSEENAYAASSYYRQDLNVYNVQ
jgi:hypothetical protein